MKLRVKQVSLKKPKRGNAPGQPRFFTIEGSFSFVTSGNARAFENAPEKAKEALVIKLMEVLDLIEIEVEEEDTTE